MRLLTLMVALTTSLMISGSAAAAGGPYKLDAQGKCRDAHGAFAKADLCKGAHMAAAPSGKCRDPKTQKYAKCGPGMVPAK
jgi:hypothetical protein